MKKLFLSLILSTLSVSTFAKAVSLGSQTINKGLLQAILAKELCSCIYVQKLNVGHDELSEEQKVPYRFDECMGRTGLPIPASVLKGLVNLNPSDSRSLPSAKQPVFTASSTAIGRLLALRINSKNQKAIAVYLGEKKGCRLLTDEEIARKQVILN
jgi:hypothetical protein